jgi:hypothetical protein
MEVPNIGTTRMEPRTDPTRAAAKDLHAALFADMLRHGGLMEAFSTGEDSLDAMASVVIDRVAEDLARRDTAFTEQLYKALQGA